MSEIAAGVMTAVVRHKGDGHLFIVSRSFVLSASAEFQPAFEHFVNMLRQDPNIELTQVKPLVTMLTDEELKQIQTAGGNREKTRRDK